MDLGLGALLGLMEYQPPPPSYEVAINVQPALSQVTFELLEESSLWSPVVAQTRLKLAVFTYHLRPLIDAAKDADVNTVNGKWAASRLTDAVKRGSEALGPVALATGISTMLVPPVGAAGAAAVAATALHGVSKEATRQVVTLASTMQWGWHSATTMQWPMPTR